MSMINGIILYQDVLAWSVWSSLLSCSALHADAVVAGIDGVIYEQHLTAAADIECITVLCVPRTAYGHSVHNDVCATCWYKVKLGRVLYRHAANKHPVAIGKSNKVGSHSLLCLWCCSQVLEMLQVEREPELSAFGLRAAHSSELLPLHVAHLGALQGATWLRCRQ